MTLQIAPAASRQLVPRDRELDQPEPSKKLDGAVAVVGREGLLVLGEMLGDLVHLGRLIHRAADEEDPFAQWSQPASRYHFTVAAAPFLNPTLGTTPSCRRALPVSQSQCPAASRTFPREKYPGRPVSHAHASATVARARRIGTGIRNSVGRTPRASPRASPTCSHVKAPSPATWKISPEGTVAAPAARQGRHQILNVAEAESPRRTGRHRQKTSCHPPGDLQDAAVSGTVDDGGAQHGDVQAIPYSENGRLTLQLAPPVGGDRTGRRCPRHTPSPSAWGPPRRGYSGGRGGGSARGLQARVDQMSSSLTIDAEKLPRRAGPRQSGHVVDLVHAPQRPPGENAARPGPPGQSSPTEAPRSSRAAGCP